MDQTTQTLTVTDGMTGRIDKELGHHFPQFSRSQLKRWIDDGTVTVNGQTVKAKYQLQAGDRVVIKPETPVEIDLEPENIPSTLFTKTMTSSSSISPRGWWCTRPPATPTTRWSTP